MAASSRVCRQPRVYASGTPDSAREQLLEVPQTFGTRRLLARRLVGGQRRARPAQVVLRELGQETRGLAFARLAPPLALPAIGKVKALLRARDADVHEPALLVDVARGDRFAMRQQAFLQPYEEHVRELEPLRRVQRREAHGVGHPTLLALE